MGVVQHLAHLAEDTVAHFGAREVEHELVATRHWVLAWQCEHPIGVCPVEVAVLVDHLWLEP